MKKLYSATFLVAFIVMLPNDSAICGGGGSGASGSSYTRARAQVPTEAGAPFLFDEKIGGINRQEFQIYDQNNYPDWRGGSPTLGGLVDEALRRNPTTRQVWQTANASALTLAAARGAYWPTATVNGATKPSYTQGPTFPGYLRTSELNYNPTLQVQYLLFDFGGREASVDVARFNFFASGFAINQTLQTVVMGVLKSYYTLVQADENVAIAQQSIVRANEIIKDIEDRASKAKDQREVVKKAKKEKSEHARIFSNGPFLSASSVAASELKLANLDLDKQNTKIQFLDDQKKLLETNLSSFKLGFEVAQGAVEAAMIQLLTSVGLPGNMSLNDESFPVSEPPQASLFSKKDFKYPDSMVTKLTQRQDEDKVSEFVWNNFSPDNQQKLAQSIRDLQAATSDDQKKSIQDLQLSILFQEFNRVVSQRIPICGQEGFPKLNLIGEAAERWSEYTSDDVLPYRSETGSHQAWAVNRLNRLVLEYAYDDQPDPSGQKPKPELEKSRRLTNEPPVRKLHEEVDTMIVDALRSRPDIANKYFSYRSAQASARQADSNVYPNLMATFTGSTTEFDRNVATDQVSGSNYGRTDNFFGALTVSIPVFDALTLVNKARSARRTADAARADLANSELNAISDVATNFKAYSSAIKQYPFAYASVFVAVDALKTAENAYSDALADYDKPLEQAKEDNCDKELGPCAKEEKRKAALKAPADKLKTALNSLVSAQTDFASSANKWSSTKLSVFTATYQLANATGALLPKYRTDTNSLRSLSAPVRPMDRR